MNTNLEKQLAVEKERADYAWKNTRSIDAARQKEMSKRDAAERIKALRDKLAKADAAILQAQAALSSIYPHRESSDSVKYEALAAIEQYQKGGERC